MLPQVPDALRDLTQPASTSHPKSAFTFSKSSSVTGTAQIASGIWDRLCADIRCSASFLPRYSML